MFYTLNKYNVICQLYLNATEKEKRGGARCNKYLGGRHDGPDG